MNESRLTISWIKNEDCTTDISVCGELNSIPRFKETFISLGKPIPIYDIKEDRTNGERGANSATTTLLSNLIEIIRKSVKTDGHIISEKELNKTFIFSDLLTIRKFADIIGIDINERKFRDRREFQKYFREIMKVELEKED